MKSKLHFISYNILFITEKFTNMFIIIITNILYHETYNIGVL